MATRVLAWDKVVELLRRYRPSLEIVKVGGGSNGIQLLCPFHTDTKPSFVFHLNKGRGQCYSCKKNANFEELVAALEQGNPADANKIASACYHKVTAPAGPRKVSRIDVSTAQLELWHTELVTDTKLQVLMKRWGWSGEVIDRYQLGSSEGKLVIPMFEGDDLVGLKYYAPGSTTIKYQNSPGSAQCCWPLENLKDDVVYLVEGEKDCLTMLSAGFNAVTFTAGAGAVPKDYIRYFAGKTVYIIYDLDEAGRKGAVNVANTLNHASKKIFIVDLPLDGIPKGDLTDAYVNAPEDFVEYIDNLCAHTDEYQAPAAVSRVTVPVEVVRTYLEDIVPHKLFYRRVNMKVRLISNSQHETTIVPKDVLLTCNRDFKEGLCQQCPAYFKTEGLNLHVKPEYPELMSMVGNNLKVQRAAIQSMTGVIETCPKFKIEQKSHQALYPVVVIPAIEADKKSHTYGMVEAWALDIPSQENEDYDVEGVVLANPETQHMELILYRMTKDAASIDSFELTDDMIERLKVFQCADHHSKTLATN